MILLFTTKRSRTEKEIFEILNRNGCNFINKNAISITDSKIYCISIPKPISLNLNRAVAIFTESTDCFSSQELPLGVIGICEDSNKQALNCFKRCNNAVITCGSNNKNTLSISSITGQYVLITLQRSIIDVNGNRIDPCEFKIKLTHNYLPFSVLAAAAALLLNGITPKGF